MRNIIKLALFGRSQRPKSLFGTLETRVSPTEHLRLDPQIERTHSKFFASALGPDPLHSTFALLRAAEHEKQPMDASMYFTLISKCLKQNQKDKALLLLEDMRSIEFPKTEINLIYRMMAFKLLLGDQRALNLYQLEVGPNESSLDVAKLALQCARNKGDGVIALGIIRLRFNRNLFISKRMLFDAVAAVSKDNRIPRMKAKDTALFCVTHCLSTFKLTVADFTDAVGYVIKFKLFDCVPSLLEYASKEYGMENAKVNEKVLRLLAVSGESIKFEDFYDQLVSLKCTNRSMDDVYLIHTAKIDLERAFQRIVSSEKTNWSNNALLHFIAAAVGRSEHSKGLQVCHLLDTTSERLLWDCLYEIAWKGSDEICAFFLNWGKTRSDTVNYFKLLHDLRHFRAKHKLKGMKLPTVLWKEICLLHMNKNMTETVEYLIGSHIRMDPQSFSELFSLFVRKRLCIVAHCVKTATHHSIPLKAVDLARVLGFTSGLDDLIVSSGKVKRENVEMAMFQLTKEKKFVEAIRLVSVWIKSKGDADLKELLFSQLLKLKDAVKRTRDFIGYAKEFQVSSEKTNLILNSLSSENYSLRIDIYKEPIMEFDLESFCVFLEIAKNNSLSDFAIEVHQRMKRDKVVHSIHSLRKLLTCLSESGDFHRSICILEELKPMDSGCFNCVMKEMIQKKCAGEGKRVVRVLLESGVGISYKLLKLCIHCLTEDGNWELMREVLERAEGKQLSFDEHREIVRGAVKGKSDVFTVKELIRLSKFSTALISSVKSDLSEEELKMYKDCFSL